MNFLILSDHYPPDKLGGVWECVKDLKYGLEQDSHSVYVLTIGNKEVEDKKNLIFRYHKNFAIGLLLNNFYAAYLIYKYKIDIILNHQSAFTLFLLLKIFKFSFPKVFSVYHGTFFSEFSEVRSLKIDNKDYYPSKREYLEKYIFAPIHILIDAWSYIFSDIISAVSKEIQNEILNTYGQILKKETFFIPNGVRVDDKLSAPVKDTNSNTIIFSGTFRTRKRVYHLLYAFNEVLKQKPNTNLILIGSGRSYEEKIIHLIREFKIEDKVTLTGRLTREGALRKIAVADIFCLPSSREGCPLALLDAISVKKACLISDSQEQFFANNLEIKTFVKDNYKDLSKKLIELLDSPETRENLGENAYQKLLLEYSLKRQTERYLELINLVLNNNKVKDRTS